MCKDQKVIHPFYPDEQIKCGATDQNALWENQIVYRTGVLLSVGFIKTVPDCATVKAGNTTERLLSRDTDTLVLWVYRFGLRERDLLAFEVT